MKIVQKCKKYKKHRKYKQNIIEKHKYK
jgi:hypothetical protein